MASARPLTTVTRRSMWRRRVRTRVTRLGRRGRRSLHCPSQACRQRLQRQRQRGPLPEPPRVLVSVSCAVVAVTLTAAHPCVCGQTGGGVTVAASDRGVAAAVSPCAVPAQTHRPLRRCCRAHHPRATPRACAGTRAAVGGARCRHRRPASLAQRHLPQRHLPTPAAAVAVPVPPCRLWPRGTMAARRRGSRGHLVQGACPWHARGVEVGGAGGWWHACCGGGGRDGVCCEGGWDAMSCRDPLTVSRRILTRR